MLTPATLLPQGAIVRVTIDGLRDASGNAVAARTETFLVKHD